MVWQLNSHSKSKAAGHMERMCPPFCLVVFRPAKPCKQAALVRMDVSRSPSGRKVCTPGFWGKLEQKKTALQGGYVTVQSQVRGLLQ